ncbi:MAG: DUF1622 domain-containing protein [Candidatus Stygibacter frigidus]|nr:DUF1622 domain-containing protein [Candidatus Stygibacter frigidus]
MEFLDTITGFFLALIIFISNFLAGLIIMIGILRSIWIYFKKDRNFIEQLREVRAIRMVIGNSFSLSLSILVGASILKTALNPTWNEIGILTAIILLRTFLTYVLMHNVDEDKKEIEDNGEEE